MVEKQKPQNKHHQLISLGQSWHEWWDIFSRNFIKWIAIAFFPWLLTYIILMLLVGKFYLSIQSITSWDELVSFNNSNIYFFIIGIILIAIIQLVGSLALVVGAIEHQKLKIKNTFTKSVQLFWDYFLLSVLLGLISLVVVIFSYVFIALLGAILGLIDTSWIDAVFSWLKLIPYFVGLLVSALLIFAPYDLVSKNNSPWNAIKNSYLLVKKYFWPVVVRLAIAYIVLFTIGVLLNLIAWVGPVLAAAFVAPAISIYLFILYRDLNKLTKT